jgi:hypothetical protein
VRDVLGEIADSFAARIASLEAEISAETAKLSALRRPILRIMSQDVMGGRKAVNAIDLLIGERRIDEAAARSLEAKYQQLADALIREAGATLEGA